MNTYLYIAIMALTTYAIRVLPLTLIRKPIKSRFLRSFLYYVPYVTLAVMTFPAITTATGFAGRRRVRDGSRALPARGWGWGFCRYPCCAVSRCLFCRLFCNSVFLKKSHPIPDFGHEIGWLFRLNQDAGYLACPLLSCNCSLSAMRAMNSELVGLPLVLETV